MPAADSTMSDPEALWAEFAARQRRGPALPFPEHWARFNEIYAGWPEENGPPPAWWPNDRDLAASNLGRLMRETGFSGYGELHRWSTAERAQFWSEVVRWMDLTFARRPDAILDLERGVKEPRWLPGARLNITESCFKAGHAETAIWSAGEQEPGLRRVTYKELEALVNRIANGLRDRGFAPGDGIALYMPMTVECVAAYLAIVRAGCTVVSIADSFPAVEVARRLRIAGAKAILTVESFLRGGKRIDLYAKVRDAGATQAIVIGATRSLRAGDVAFKDLLGGDADFAAHIAGPYDTTNVLFSSGTTGDPKAIPWTHLTPLKSAMDGCFHHDIRPGDVVAWPTNIGWMMGPWLIYAGFMNRAAIALYEGLPSGEGFTRFVKEAGVTMLGVVPSLVRAWRAQHAVGFDGWPKVRVFSSTGEPSSREEYLWLMSRAGYRAPIIEYLGGTEIGGGHITGTVAQPASPATFTTPALGIDFVVLDEKGDPVPEGGSGELYLIPPSIGLSQKLLHRDHEEVYYAGCPKGPGGAVLRRHGDETQRLYRGYYRAQGRADDTMNLGGIKVSSLELERVMAGHEEVYECAAVAVQPEGEGAAKLVVFAVPAQGAQPDPATLKRELQKRIAKELNPLFKIHDLVLTETLPRTASNKLMRRELRRRWRGGRPTTP